MIYPPKFPNERLGEYAEKAVYDRLQALGDTHDIYYSNRFVNNSGRKKEYEVDFIIAKPNQYVVVLEVKGGIIRYDKGRWSQNGSPMSKDPELQVSSSCHALVKRYNSLSRSVPFIWMLCFPDCELPNGSTLPPNLTPYHIIDRSGLYDVAKTLRLCIEQQGVSQRDGRVRDYVYSNFKTDLLRDIGFVKTLGVSIKYQEEQFVDLTSIQLGLVEAISENRKIIIHGAAGTGKTIVAKHMALRLFDEGESVLFLCFNRLLANKIRESINIRKVEKEKFQVTTFHSIARDIITQADPQWWDINSRSEDEFWALEVPSKMDEVLESLEIEKYDTIIIDEGQDFKEFWFDVLFKLCKPNARKYIFIDSMQNIFGHYSEVPNKESFFRYRLTENLRNTKSIVRYINKKVNTQVKVAEKSPEGAAVIEIDSANNVELVKNLIDLINDLVSNHNVVTSQILILIGSTKAASPISELKKIGNYPLKSLDRKARFEKDLIHYSNIQTFKGLEQDVLIILAETPTTLINFNQMFYTQASRAKHGLYCLSILN